MPNARARAISYWVSTALLCGIGAVGLLSIGMPFLLMGLTLASVGPWRENKRVFWPVVVGVMGLIVGYMLVTPLGCTMSATSVASMQQGQAIEKSHTVCSNLLGINYSGTGTYNPPREPALIAGWITALAGTITALIVTTRMSHTVRSSSAEGGADQVG